MTLAVYKEVSEGIYVKAKEWGILDPETSPISTTHDAVLGEVVEIKLFVRNDDALKYYTTTVVSPVVKDGTDDVSGIVTGHGVKLCYSPIQPTEAEWDAIDYGTTITIGAIGESGLGDTSSYLPFWCRVEVPPTGAGNKENITLKIAALEHAV